MGRDKIARISLYVSRMDLQEPFIISLGPLTAANNVLVKITTADGCIGWGESSPFPTIHGETHETGFIIGRYIAEAFLHKDANDIEALSREMDRLMYGNTSIKSAFDMALHDIAAQKAGLPLYAWLGGKNDKQLITDYTVSLKEPEEMARDAGKIKSKGFKIIKVKLGQSGEKDVKRIRLIREAIGYEMPVRIDPNQGWDPETAIRILNELAKFDIQHCEEPIPRWNFMELSRVRENSPIPIMADESCFDHHDAQRLLDLNACDRFNIKLGKSSGFVKARKIIALGEQHNIKMQVGGFLESRLGFTAAAHLALTGRNIVFYDFDTPLMFRDDPVIGGIKYGPNGEITVPDAPGLGATIDEGFLKGMEKVVVE